MREGEVLRMLRVINGYDSIVDLSRACSISPRTLSGIENGTRCISAIALRTLADLYEIPLSLLVLAFRNLYDFDYDYKPDRKKAYYYLLRLSQYSEQRTKLV